MGKEQEIYNAIQNLPINEEGKKAVIKLVESLGFKANPPTPTPKVGQVWSYGDDDEVTLLVVSIKNVNRSEENHFVRLDGRYRPSGTCFGISGVEYNLNNQEVPGPFKLLANTLEEYYASKNN